MKINFRARSAPVLQVLCFFFFVLLPSFAHSTICRNTAHCDDGDTGTIDFCWVPHSACMNIAKDTETNKTLVLSALSSMLNKTNEKPLTVSEKRSIVSAAGKIMAELNPHRFLQLNLLQVDIVEELRRFESSLEASSERYQSNVEFHMKMTSIFQKMDDRHTAYLLPPPLQFSWASLFFNVKEYFDKEDAMKLGKPRRRYVVADVATGHKFEHSAFAKGAEILKWDGIDMNTFVLRLGRDTSGSNSAAQISNAVVLLTTRFLQYDPIPLKPFIDIQFRDLNGNIHTVRTHWSFFQVNSPDLVGAMRQRMPFAWRGAFPKRPHDKIRSERVSEQFMQQKTTENLHSARITGSKRKKIAVNEDFEDFFSAEVVQTKDGPIGHLTLPSFGLNATAQLVLEMSRVLRLMPRDGLVVDIRYNLGGFADYVKAVSELISDKKSPDQPVTVRATELTSALFRAEMGNCTKSDLTRMHPCPSSVETARMVGEAFTGPVGSLYSPGAVSSKQEQAYSGPVITVTNGRTHSAGDVFAALQVDNNLSLVVGTSDNVGAGGATTIRYGLLAGDFPSILKPLPGGVDFSTSLHRYYRTGANLGAIVENFGVKPQVRYYPTLNDAVNEDCDFFDFLGKTLASMSTS